MIKKIMELVSFMKLWNCLVLLTLLSMKHYVL